MKQPDKIRQIKYWRAGAKRSLRLASDVFDKGYYDHALFCAHLALEKLLKSMVIEARDTHAPRSHDLLYLAGLAEVDLDVARQKFLIEVNAFNIEGRYPEEKLEFHRRATKAMTARWLEKITDFYVWLSKRKEEK